MEEHPNAVRYRHASEDFRQGGFEGFLDLLDGEVVWWEIGRAEPTRGKQALVDRMQQQAGAWQITARLHDVVANDEHMVALVNVEAKRGDRTLAYRTAEIFHVRDGRITERWAFSDDTAAIAEFFA